MVKSYFFPTKYTHSKKNPEDHEALLSIFRSSKQIRTKINTPPSEKINFI